MADWQLDCAQWALVSYQLTHDTNTKGSKWKIVSEVKPELLGVNKHGVTRPVFSFLFLITGR